MKRLLIEEIEKLDRNFLTPAEAAAAMEISLSTFYRNRAPEQGELFLVFEYTEPVGRENRGIDERFKGDLIVPSLDDNGFLDLKHGGSPSQSGSEIP